MKITRVVLTAALALGLFSCVAQADELLGNNGFEMALEAPDLNPEGNFSPFAGSAGGPAPGFPIQDNVQPNSGSFHLTASMNGEDAAFAGIQQVFSGIIEGETYTYSLFAATPGALGLNAEFRIEWLDAGGNFVGGQFDNNVDITAGLSGTYAQFTQSDAAPAGAVTGRAVFAIQSFGGGDNTGTVYVDDVSVQGNVIPEPTSAGLIALGLVGLVARRRR